MNLADANFQPAPCMPCGPAAPAPTDCSCALLIPPMDSPYADYATAAAVLALPLVADCMAFCVPGNPVSAATATFDGTTFTYTPTFSSPVPSYGEVWISMSIEAGKTITITSANYSNIFAVIYTCDGVEVETINTTSPATSAAIVTAGEYLISIIPFNPGLGAFTTDTLTVTASGVWWVNPVIALWDDSGTTRNLWACPKLLLPPLTESTGDWYASCADANTALTTSTASGTVSNCVGYDAVNSTLQSAFSFTATDYGTSLDFSHSATGAASGGPASTTRTMLAWGGFNASAGDVITVAWSCSGTMGTGFNGTATLYDDAGVFVEVIGNTTGASASFAALPYTGRYTIKVVIQPDVVIDNRADFAALASISSSGSFSVNPIQARYDLGLTCAGLLDCGDTCP